MNTSCINLHRLKHTGFSNLFSCNIFTVVYIYALLYVMHIDKTVGLTGWSSFFRYEMKDSYMKINSVMWDPSQNCILLAIEDKSCKN